LFLSVVMLRVPVGRRAFFLGSITPAHSSQQASLPATALQVVGTDYFMNFDAKVATGQELPPPPPSSTTTTGQTCQPPTEGEKSVVTNDESLFARLADLERQEEAADNVAKEKAGSAKLLTQQRKDHHGEIVALEQRMSEIKTTNDYDENNTLMKELKQLRARHRAINLLTQNRSPSQPNTTTTTTQKTTKTTTKTTTPSQQNTTTSTKKTNKTTTSIVRKLQDLGNKAFKDKDYGEAISNYSAAIAADTDNVQHHVLLSNRSISWHNSRFFKEAEDDAHKIIALKPQWVKGYYRLASAMLGRLLENGSNNTDDVLRVIERGLDIEIENKGLKKLKKRIQEMRNKAAEQIHTNGNATNAFSGKILEHSDNDDKRAQAEENRTTEEQEPPPKKKMSAFRRRRMGLE
jgi:tetratricopeptide (TPR) repeat protein